METPECKTCDGSGFVTRSEHDGYAELLCINCVTGVYMRMRKAAETIRTSQEELRMLSNRLTEMSYRGKTD